MLCVPAYWKLLPTISKIYTKLHTSTVLGRNMKDLFKNFLKVPKVPLPKVPAINPKSLGFEHKVSALPKPKGSFMEPIVKDKFLEKIKNFTKLK
jgi:hypothetical protein